jgi:hypothetical protein
MGKAFFGFGVTLTRASIQGFTNLAGREPTAVNGMWYDSFTAGGFTSGGAREYVSKLDNTEAIDSLETIE